MRVKNGTTNDPRNGASCAIRSPERYRRFADVLMFEPGLCKYG